MAERTTLHLLLQHMREVADIIGFGKGIHLESLAEALDESQEVTKAMLTALREQGCVSQDSPVYGGGWWITGPGHDRLETLEFFGY